MGHTSNGDAMFRFHRLEVFLQLLDHSHLLLRMRQRILLLQVQVLMIGLLQRTITYGDELAQIFSQELFPLLDHQLR